MATVTIPRLDANSFGINSRPIRETYPVYYGIHKTSHKRYIMKRFVDTSQSINEQMFNTTMREIKNLYITRCLIPNPATRSSASSLLALYSFTNANLIARNLREQRANEIRREEERVNDGFNQRFQTPLNYERMELGEINNRKLSSNHWELVLDAEHGVYHPALLHNTVYEQLKSYTLQAPRHVLLNELRQKIQELELTEDINGYHPCELELERFNQEKTTAILSINDSSYLNKLYIGIDDTKKVEDTLIMVYNIAKEHEYCSGILQRLIQEIHYSIEVLTCERGCNTFIINSLRGFIVLGNHLMEGEWFDAFTNKFCLLVLHGSHESEEAKRATAIKLFNEFGVPPRQREEFLLYVMNPNTPF